MITIGFSTRKRDDSFIEHVKSTCNIKGVEVICYENNGEYSLTELYNRILSESKHNIVCLIHDDIVINTKNWGKKILSHFENTDYGILGMAGTTNIDTSGQWWRDRNKMVGIVTHNSDGKSWVSKYSSNFGSDVIQTIMLDGLFLIVNKDRIKKNFNEDVKGFHFYDFDFTFSNHLEGVKVGVIFDVKLTHKSVGGVNKEWDVNRLEFCNRYSNHLPYDLPVQLKYDDKPTKPPKTQPKLAVIIPTKGNINLLKDCVDSIFEKDPYRNLKVYIADTGSTDEEKEQIKQDIISHHGFFSDKHRTVVLIEYDYYNFASINNDVVKEHIDKDTELLLFCNNDIKLVNDAISRMVKVYTQNKKTVGTIGARLHFGNNEIQHSGVIMSLVRHDKLGVYFPSLTHHGLGSYYNYHQNNVEVFGNTAAFLMISKVLFNGIGGFNDGYVECFEDVKLNIDCLTVNKKNIFVGDAVCYHYESQSRGKVNGKQSRELRDLQKLMPHIVNNKKTYKYFSNVKADVLTQILEQQTREINQLVR